MATSETLAFNPSVSQCIQEAYQRCNVQLTSGMSLSTALFSLNILLYLVPKVSPPFHIPFSLSLI